MVYQRHSVKIGEIDIPVIKAVNFMPSRMIPFNEAIASLNKEITMKGTVHMFISDRHLERTWTFAETYAEKLKNFEAVLSPDFSLYADWDNPFNLYNLYRNRFVGAYFQQHGLTVIPTVTWSSKKTYDFAFLGLEPEGTYAVSANGCFSNDKYYRNIALGIYQDGMKEFVKRLNPRRILVHGSIEAPEADYGDAQVLFYKSKMSAEKNWRYSKFKKPQEQKEKPKWDVIKIANTANTGKRKDHSERERLL